MSLRQAIREQIRKSAAFARQIIEANKRRARNLNFDGNGRVQVQDVGALVRSPKVQAQVAAARKLQEREPWIKDATGPPSDSV